MQLASYDQLQRLLSPYLGSLRERIQEKDVSSCLVAAMRNHLAAGHLRHAVINELLGTSPDEVADLLRLEHACKFSLGVSGAWC